MLPFFMWLNFMGWFRSESVQELVGLDISYGADALQAKEEEEGIKEEYLDAYQRYRKAQKRPAKNKPDRSGIQTADDDKTEEPIIEVPSDRHENVFLPHIMRINYD